MFRPFSICCSLAAAAVLTLTGLAPAQSKPAPADDAKLQALEAKLQALLAEIKALRAAPDKPAPAATKVAAVKIDDKKPSSIRVTVDGDKVTIVDAATGKVISSGDADKAIKLWHDSQGKTTEKKVIVLGDDAKKAGVGDAKTTERKVIVLGPDGKEVKGERKVIVVDDDKGEKKSEKSEKKAARVIELKDGAFRFSVPATPATPKAPAAPKPPELPALPSAPARVEVPARPATVAWAAAPNKPGEPAYYSWSLAAGGGDTVMLSRTTYSIPRDKARALESFLKEYTTTKVLETKIDGDKLVVTTTPDVQGTIGALVAMMTGKQPGASTYRYQLTTPAKPAEPKKP